jgi:phosphatidylglycerophosphatase A
LVGLLLAWCVSGWQGVPLVLFIAVFCALAVWVSQQAEGLLGGKDPGAIVIDEIAGMLVACAWIPLTATTAVILFALFRLFDILKPFPVGWLDRRLSGGVGIVADDLAAGLLANLVYRLGCWLIVVS